MLTLRLSPTWRRLAVLGGTLAGVGAALVSETFTDLGHLIAWGIGLAMGQVGLAVARHSRS